MPNTTVRLLKTLIAVDESNGLRAAAKVLGVSAASVSRAIDQLQAVSEHQLLIRTPRGTKLTNAGRVAADRARQLIGQLENADLSLTSGGNVEVPSGPRPLRLSAPPVLGRELVNPVVVSFLKARPSAKIQCVYLDRRVDMFDEQIDVSISLGVTADPAVDRVEVGRASVYLCAATKYLEERGRPTSAGDLAAHDVLRPLGDTQQPVGKMLGEMVDRPGRERFSSTEADSLLAAAVAGLGVAPLWCFQATRLIQQGVLERVLPDVASSEVSIFMSRAARPRGDTATVELTLQLCEWIRRNLTARAC